MTAHPGARIARLRTHPVRLTRSRRDSCTEPDSRHHDLEAPQATPTLALSTGLLLAVGTPATVAGAHPGHPSTTRRQPPRASSRGTARRGRARDGRADVARGTPGPRRPTARDGTLRLTDQGGVTKVAGKIPVYNHDEEGLQGVGIDPDFEKNRAI